MKVASIQFRGEAFQADSNRNRTVTLIEEAADQGANVVILPELAISGYALDQAGLASAAEPVEGTTLAAWSAIARRRNIVIVGGFCERDGSRLYNSALMTGPDGLLLHYRKLHLFDTERLIFAPGDKGLTVADTPFGRIGLCVCYDLRFVEVVRALALQGAILAAVPTAWVAGFDPNPRDSEGVIKQVRGAALQANLNQIYIACASQAGRTGGTAFLGSSMIADPFGALVAGPLDDSAEQILISSVLLEVIEAAQHRSALINPRDDRRTDVYGLRLGDAIY